MKMRFDELDIGDLRACLVWRFTNSDEDELEIESCVKDQYANLDGLIIGNRVSFSDGSSHWALFQNVSLADQRVNDHFLTLTIHREGKWFPLARYHDVGHQQYGPPALADFMKKRISDVFPIHYDLRNTLNSDSSLLTGVVPAEPSVRLTEDQIISLALM
jgi:hypothetical protein